MVIRILGFWASVFRSGVSRQSVLFLLTAFLAWPSGSACFKAQTCQPKSPVFNVTLLAGSASGSFWKLGRVKDVNYCGHLCCQHPGCDLAFSVDDICYTVKCHNQEMCRLKEQGFSHHRVAVILVSRRKKDDTGNPTYRHERKENRQIFTTLRRKGAKGNDKIEEKSFNEEKRFRKPSNLFQNTSLTSYESEDKGIDFEAQNSFPIKSVTRLFSNKATDGISGLEMMSSSTCNAGKVLRQVTLQAGLKSGDFSDYGEVPDMSACVKYCCAQKSCDVSLLLNSHCYTLHCHKPELCETIPAHASNMKSQLAFVIRSVEDQSKTRVKKKTSSSNRDLCPHGAIFRDVSLKGGKKAGNFQILPGARDMRTCIKKCCESASCQVAWLLGDHCYSVACYDKCITVKKRPDSIQSQLTLLTGKPRQFGNNKRQDIPGAKGSTDKEFTVFLTITDRIFTDNLKDIESLEFLNLAEKLQVAISTVFASSPSLQPEVISFRPSPVVAELKLTAKSKTPASDVLRRLLAAVKSGLLKSSIDGIPVSFKISEAGFRFVTSSGLNLVCGPQHDYDINWKLAMFNTIDNQTCPRKAQGKTRRLCAGSESQNATWQEPNFSECVSPAYKTLHQQSKDLVHTAAKQIPFAKEAAPQIITRLEKLVFSDTYRDEIIRSSRADQQRNFHAAKKDKGKKKARLHDKPSVAKKPSKNDGKGKSDFVPVTELPKARTETVPTSATQRVEDHNPVWFSKAKQTASNLRNNHLIQPITAGQVLPTPRSQAPPGGSVLDDNRVPTQAPPIQRPRDWSLTGGVQRSSIQNGVLSNRAMGGQSQIGRTLNMSPIRNTYRIPNRVPNQRFGPYLVHASDPYQIAGNQAWQGNRASYPNAWGGGYAPPNYPRNQIGIGRRKRDVDFQNRRRRQNPLLYNSRRFPAQYNNPAIRGLVPSSSFQGQRNYFAHNENALPVGYRRPVYGQYRGMRISPAGSQPNQVQDLRYRTQPGISPGGHPVPVERWPSFVNPIEKPTLALNTHTTPRRVIATSMATIQSPTSRILHQAAEIKGTIAPSKKIKPIVKQATVPLKKQADKSVHKTAGLVNSKPKQGTKKLQDMTAVLSKSNETHVVPMFGGDILHSVGVLTFLQKLAQLSGSAVTETEFKLFVNSSSHLLDLRNQQEWRNAQKYAEVLSKRGINVLEDSNNWDRDESREVTNKESEIGPVVLDLVATVQDFVMNASHSVPLSKPLLTKNILFGVKTFGSASSDLTRPISFPNYSDPVVANWSTGHDSVTMTPSIFEPALLGKSGNVHILTSRFKTIPHLLPLANNSGLVLNSAVLSSTISPAVKGELNPPVKLVMSVLNSSLVKFDQQCMAWTLKKSPGSKGGKWSPEGCKLTSSNETHTTCECNHMTDFAVLADTDKPKGTGSAPHPSAAVPSPGARKGRSWIGILFAILAVLVIIIIVLMLLFYWKKKRRNEEETGTPRPRSRGLQRSRSLSRSTAKASRSSSSKSDGASSPTSSHSSQFDEMIAARKRKMARDKQEKARRTKEEGLDDEDDDELLMKEKAMLFSDYHQPYHFLSTEGEKRREQPGSGKPSPSVKSRRSAMDERGSDV